MEVVITTPVKIDLRHPLLRGIIKDLSAEFGVSPLALRHRYFRGNAAVVKRVIEEAEKRIERARDIKQRAGKVMEAIAA